MNHGGPAFPSGMSETPRYEKALPYYEGMTLLDWFAGQALAGSLASQSKESHWVFATVEDETADDRVTKGISALCYDLATALLSEKARREADHSGGSNKMMEDHSPDATKMIKLEAQNRELVERIKRLEQAGDAMHRYYDATSRCVWKQAKETKP